jgi:HSP20 family protein
MRCVAPIFLDVGAASAQLNMEKAVMVSIARYTPFEDAFDDLFRGFLANPSVARNGVAQFRVDVTENENAYNLRAEIPGVKKDDIQITVDGDTVAISAEVRNEKEVKNGERVLRTERQYGKAYRAFALGQPVDEAAASAKYADGVLELTLPKKAEAQAKRITVQ